MTGSLSGTLDGRPVSLHATGQTLAVEFSGLRGAFRAVRHPLPWDRLRAILSFLGLKVTAKVGVLPAVEILPNPHPAARLLTAGLS
ncbi:MAG: hypothetical protein AAGJ46_15555 [Planctomycetota bacterium]